MLDRLKGRPQEPYFDCPAIDNERVGRVELSCLGSHDETPYVMRGSVEELAWTNGSNSTRCTL